MKIKMIILISIWQHVDFSENSFSGGVKGHTTARRQWLTPVILATQEAEIRRIEV
jgi:hypothetical protein